MPAIKKPNPIPQEDLGGNTKKALDARAKHARQFSLYGHPGGPRLESEVKREWHRKGGIASAESKRRRKTLANLMKVLLDQPAGEDMMKVCGIVDMFPEMDPSEITYGMLLTMSVLGRGISTGRSDQYTVIRDTIGEKPKDNLSLTGGDGEPLNPPNVTVLFEKARNGEL